MNCPTCRHPDHLVLRSKPSAGAIRRTRKCCQCGHRWTTLELLEDDLKADRETLAEARKLAAALVDG